MKIIKQYVEVIAKIKKFEVDLICQNWNDGPDCLGGYIAKNIRRAKLNYCDICLQKHSKLTMEEIKVLNWPQVRDLNDKTKTWLNEEESKKKLMEI